MDYTILFYFSPAIIFTLIAWFTFWTMIGVATKKKYFDGSPNPWYDGRDGLIGLESIGRFRMIKNQITDKKKQIKYKRIYLGFLLSIILAPVSSGIAILMLL